MRTIIAAIFLILASSAHAQSVGCWYDFNSNTCDPYQVYCYISKYTNLSYYGSNIANLCEAKDYYSGQYDKCIGTLKSCDDAYNTVKAKYDTCIGVLSACDATNKQNEADFNTCAAAYNSCESARTTAETAAISYAASQAKLIKKLRRACGSKCTRIK